MTAIQYAVECAPSFRTWATSYAKEHSISTIEYKKILHWLIFKYQLHILKQLENVKEN